MTTERRSQNSQDDHDVLIRLDQKVDGIVETQQAIQSQLEKGSATYATIGSVDAQKKRIDAIMAFGGAILLAVTTALVIAFIKLAGSHL